MDKLSGKILKVETGNSPPFGGGRRLPKQAVQNKLALHKQFYGKQSFHRKIFLKLLFRYLAIGCLALVILPNLWGNAHSDQRLEAVWRAGGGVFPIETTMYVTEDTDISDYPHLSGKLTEFNRSAADDPRFVKIWTRERNPDTGVWSNSGEVHINEKDPSRKVGTDVRICTGETKTVRVHDRYYGTWYFQTETLLDERRNSFDFWFCPKKSYLNKLPTNRRVEVELKFQLRVKELLFGGILFGSREWKDVGNQEKVKITLFRTDNGLPDLRWKQGGRDEIKSIVSDGSSNYGDIQGTIVNSSKPELANVESIRAVQEIWNSSGVSTSRTWSNKGNLKEEVGYPDFGGLDRPFGENLSFGTWYFSNNYQRYLFRPNSDAINSMPPGGRVTSVVTYAWHDPKCHACPNGILRSDTASVVITRPDPVSISWDSSTGFAENSGTLTGGSALASCYNATVENTIPFSVELGNPADSVATETRNTVRAGENNNVASHRGVGAGFISGVNLCNVVSDKNAMPTTGFGISEFNYGYWIRSNSPVACRGSNNQCLNVAFVPNPSNISKMLPTDSVVSTLKIPVKTSLAGAATHHFELTVTINGNLHGTRTAKFETDSYVVEKDDGSVEVKVLLDKYIESDLTVNYTIGGNAVEGMDYTAPNPTSIVFEKSLNNSGLEKSITIPILDNNTEGGTTANQIVLTLTDGGSDYGLGVLSTTTIAIVEESSTISFVPDSLAVSVPEGDEVVELDVLLSDSQDSAVEVNYMLLGISATVGEDFMDPPTGRGIIEIPAGATNGTITINILSDELEENAETFTVTLQGGPDFRVEDGKETARVTIFDDNKFSNDVISCDNERCVWFTLHHVENTIIVSSSQRYVARYDNRSFGLDIGTATTRLDYVASHRLNGGNWTHSDSVPSTASRVPIPSERVAVADNFYQDAIHVSAPGKYGDWYITGPGGHSAADDRDNSRYTFIPTDNAFTGLEIGDVVDVKIQVTLTYFGIHGGDSKILEIGTQIMKNDGLGMSWEPNNNPNIFADGTSTYGDIYGLISPTPQPEFAFDFTGTVENAPNGAVTHATVANTRELADKFRGWDLPVGENFEYGFWVVSRYSDKFLFRPNSQKINDISCSGDIVTSRLTIEPTEMDQPPVYVSVRISSARTVRVGISTSTPQVVEGNSAEFTVNVIGDSAPCDLLIPIRATETGRFAFVAPTLVQIPRGQNSAQFKVSTSENRNSSNGGRISVSLRSGQFHEIDSSNQSADVSVTKSPTSNSNTRKYSVAASVITSILQGIPPTRSPSLESEQVPTVQITSDSTSVAEGGTIYFAVSTDSESILTPVSVQVELADEGDFIGGNSIRSVTLSSVQREEVISVATIDDAIAESDGKVTATVLPGYGYVPSNLNSSVVNVTDAADRATRRQEIMNVSQTILPDLSASFASGSLELAANRMNQTFDGSEESRLELGGQSTVKGFLASRGNTLNSGDFDWRSFLGESAAVINLFPEEGISGSGTVWAYGDHDLVSSYGKSQSTDWNGEVFTGRFGFDTKLNQKAVLGLSSAVMEADANYQNSSRSVYNVRTRNLGVYPYLGLSMLEGDFRLQTIAGYGSGDIRIDQENYDTLNMDNDTYTAALGFKRNLNIGSDMLENSEWLSISGESWMVWHDVSARESYIGDLSTFVRQLHLSIDGTKQFAFQNGNVFSPTATIGMRERAKDSFSRIDLEFGSELGFESPLGWKNSMTGQIFFGGNETAQTWGVKNTLVYNHGNDEYGLDFQLATSLGENSDGKAQILGFSKLDSTGFGTNPLHEGKQIESQASYGIGFGNHSAILLTPYGGINLFGNGSVSYDAGSRLAISPNHEFEIRFSQGTSSTDHSADKIHAGGRVSW